MFYKYARYCNCFTFNANYKGYTLRTTCSNKLYAYKIAVDFRMHTFMRLNTQKTYIIGTKHNTITKTQMLW